jgi:hypothetical protein
VELAAAMQTGVPRGPHRPHPSSAPQQPRTGAAVAGVAQRGDPARRAGTETHANHPETAGIRRGPVFRGFLAVWLVWRELTPARVRFFRAGGPRNRAV